MLVWCACHAASFCLGSTTGNYATPEVFDARPLLHLQDAVESSTPSMVLLGADRRGGEVASSSKSCLPAFIQKCPLLPESFMAGYTCGKTSYRDLGSNVSASTSLGAEFTNGGGEPRVLPVTRPSGSSLSQRLFWQFPSVCC